MGLQEWSTRGGKTDIQLFQARSELEFRSRGDNATGEKAIKYDYLLVTQINK